MNYYGVETILKDYAFCKKLRLETLPLVVAFAAFSVDIELVDLILRPFVDSVTGYSVAVTGSFRIFYVVKMQSQRRPFDGRDFTGAPASSTPRTR